MGFLYKEAKLQRVQEYEKQAEIEKNRLAEEAQAARQKLLNEEKTHAPEDNRSIIALLDSLPDCDLEGYLAIVERHTRYSSDLVLYTRLALFDQKEQLRLLEQDQELMDKLRKKGINPVKEVLERSDEWSWYSTRIATLTPKAMFCGIDDYNPTKGLFGLTPITEPQVPGIGISFSRWAGTKLTDSIDVVFARFVDPATAIINGDPKVLTVTSWEVFDNALERAFKSPCRYVVQTNSQKFKGGYTG